MHRFMLVIISILALVHISVAIVCTEDFCDKIVCKEAECAEGETEVDGLCGCCKECKIILSEGAACIVSPVLFPGPDSISCGENLVCFENKCTKEKDVVSAIAGNKGE